MRTDDDVVFALKIIRNRQAFRRQAETEVELLQRLVLPSASKKAGADGAAAPQAGKRDNSSDARSLVVQLHEHFSFRNHLCLVFEPLGVNLLQLLQQNQCTGLSCSLIRYFSKQLLQVLSLLREIGIIHCDLKPENILLQNLHSPAIKLIDFGSACHASRPMHTYIQSRFYRSPEVLLGCRYGTPIDIWSMGAIVGELFLGLPLFPGESEYNQMARIVTLRGVPPGKMLDAAPLAQKFFERTPSGPGGTAGSGGWKLKSEAQYCLERGNGTQPCRNKQYFKYRTLPELIRHHPPPKSNASPADADAEHERRSAMLHFIEGLLQLEPADRWTPLQAVRHPFITGEPFSGTFIPPVSAGAAAASSASGGVGGGGAAACTLTTSPSIF